VREGYPKTLRGAPAAAGYRPGVRLG
jgi:hypothetical protein